ncbi:hypothetical protein Z517_04144 [Fonsecaea pedrosoi CBS 271.37]|uniref:Xylanolytic transcriptional activator regulatory domain-containing protein n=1 Tax=Fonsecaea pedrosoi CBS 271.37 TaxID=1442368 RepID=A0A0D2DTL6_9EURO|nr:uncharacterized protein Z517_04144 [Fonsecaea pedrosoi CBS 271.37]KIW81121.1 hypothetical protein Z517_04144 [Fonsecaea pedrosoi CBS 271.37]
MLRTKVSSVKTVLIEFIEEQEDLIARVASLETKLAQLSQLNALIPTLTNASGQSKLLDGGSVTALNDTGTWSDRSLHSPSVGSTSPQSVQRRSFQELPPISVLENACNTFFQYCHNQPYTFFHEGNFRERLQQGTWPNYLLFAFLASALRYSTDPWFEGKHSDALEEYAAASWRLIVGCGCAVEEGADTAVVQAISLLAVIDSAAGRRRAAWVKIGLAVRISQDLHLMMDPATSLPETVREERRRLFWSIYLLDRFVSCSKQRPPAILDSDCQVQLPCDELDFRQGIAQKTETLTNLGTGASSGHPAYRPGQFALLVLMACVLGRCARYMLDNRDFAEERAPFNPQSDYVTISSILLYYESFIDSGRAVEEIVRLGMLKQDGVVDQQMVGHMILARVLFHLCHCLLNHPFLLRQRVNATQEKTPTTWLARSLEVGLEHAGRLTRVFRDAKDTGCTVATSFYGYCLLVAGTIHALYTHSQDPELQQESMGYLISDIAYLDDIARYWKNTKLIASGLRTFWGHSARFSSLLDPKPSPSTFSILDLEILWTSVDYGIMSDPDKSLSQSVCASDASPLGWGMSPWKDDNDLVDHISDADDNPFLHSLAIVNSPLDHATGTRTPGQHRMSLSSIQPFLQLNSVFGTPNFGLESPKVNEPSINIESDHALAFGLTRARSLS